MAPNTRVIVRSAIRRPANYYAAFATEVAGPLMRAAARWWTREPTPPDSWRRGLILGDHHIGDVLYRTSSLPALRRGLPHCEWDYLASRTSAEVLANNPCLRRIIPVANSDDIHRLENESLRELRANAYDVALCTNVTRYWPSLLLALRLRIANRVAFVHKGLSGLVTLPVAASLPRPFPDYTRQMVAWITGHPGDWDLRPLVYPSAADEQEADEFWRHHDVASGEPVLACFVTSRQPTGVWPADRFAEVLRVIASQSRIRILLFGAPGDQSTLERVRRLSRDAAAVCSGALGLRALVEVLRRCNAVLSTDSGPRHLANAAGVPVVFIRNLHFSRVEAGAYCETERDVANADEFVPPSQQSSAFARIESAEVARQVLLAIERSVARI